MKRPRSSDHDKDGGDQPSRENAGDLGSQPATEQETSMNRNITSPSGYEGLTFLARFDRDLKLALATRIQALWSHHSTAIEGNQLSLGDTMFVLSEGMTISGKSVRDHTEVIGHAVAISQLYGMVGRDLTKADACQLHKAVQSGSEANDYYHPLGEYKREPNAGNQIFLDDTAGTWDYPDDTKIPKLMESWFRLFSDARQSAAKSDEDAIDAYARVHLGFTAIHPFSDGNGRTGRLVANLPVIATGRPPILIPVSDRKHYIQLVCEYTRDRGPITVDQPLIKDSSRYYSMFTGFVADKWKDSLALVAEFTEMQAVRRRNR